METYARKAAESVKEQYRVSELERAFRTIDALTIQNLQLMKQVAELQGKTEEEIAHARYNNVFR